MIVGLYIKVQEQYDASIELVVDSFKERVEGDGGTFEAGTCLQNTIESLGSPTPVVAYRNVFKRIELFEDEKISVTSSIQNINDISKVFTDYSQTFTIPASDNNNEIFKYWYDSSIDNGFDQRLRYDGYIEIDTRTFRVGKWQLESASVKENKIEDYKITFYGDLKSLTDKFGDDKLKDIETLNDYTIEYSGANVQNSITTTGNPNVIFPLISSDRVWQYGTSGSQDISQNSHHIHFTELFPSLKVARIFDAIETKYNVNFSGSFLNQSRFNLAYLWLKNGESTSFRPMSEPQTVVLSEDYSDNDFFTIENNVLNLYSFGSPNLLSSFTFTITITFPSTVTSNLLIYKDDSLYTTISQTGPDFAFTIDQNTGVGRYSFKLQSNVSTNYNSNSFAQYYQFPGGFTTLQDYNGVGYLSANLDLASIMPDIKVSDFFSGILKMFNLTAFSTDGVNFTLEQLENWYYQGQIKDFSEYCVTDFDFNRIKPYKKINFEYEKSENFLSRNFFSNNSREYGNLSYTFNNDGSDYTVKLPFENLMFQKFTGTNLQVGYALKPEFSPYTPKPIILYKYENKSCSFYLNNGTTTNLISNYNVMGQDVKYSSLNHSLNWGVEISSYLLAPVNNSLFNNYYLAYLSNLYSLKSRMVKIKMRLPYTELLDLKLNDRILIRDKRYVINQYTTDLTTFESDFELIEDFRSIYFNNSRLIQTDATLKTLSIETTSAEPLVWSIESDIDSMLTGISFDIQGIKIEVKQNTSGLQRSASIVSNLNDRIIITQDA